MSEGVLYVAFGDRYQAEARRSIRSLRKVSNLPVAVVTDRIWDDSGIVFVTRKPLPSLRSKPLHIYEASPFDRTLFVDTDTVFASDIAPVFGMLDHYDIGVRFGGAWLEDAELHFHTQCNSGVILFRKSDEVAALFRNWLAMYDNAAAIKPEPNDQRHLAGAIARSRARPAHLASYLNFTLFDTLATSNPPVIYHGRGEWIESLAAEINAEWDRKTDWQTRVWLPNIFGFLPRGIRHSDPLLAVALYLLRRRNLRHLSRNSPMRKTIKPKVELTISHRDGSVRKLIVDAEKTPDGKTLFKPPVVLAPGETCTNVRHLGTTAAP